jgi:hypothetical protein
MKRHQNTVVVMVTSKDYHQDRHIASCAPRRFVRLSASTRTPSLTRVIRRIS